MSKSKTITLPMPDPKRRKGFEMAIDFAADFWTEIYCQTTDIPAMRSVLEVVNTLVASEKFSTAYDLLYVMMMIKGDELIRMIPPCEDDTLVRSFMEGGHRAGITGPH